MDAADALSDRVSDPALRKLALEGSEKPVSVLIELAVPEQDIEYEPHEIRGQRSRPLQVRSSTKRERKEIEKTAAEAQRFLERLLDEPPIYLRSARGFAATVTGSQLREVASRPFVKSIARNRTLLS